MNDEALPALKNPKLWQVAEVTVSYRNHDCLRDAPRIAASIDAERIFRENWSNDMELLEESVALFLNRASQPKGLLRLSRGGHCGTVVDLKILFAAALKAMASGIILAHNHPSGYLAPSEADIEITRKVQAAGRLFDLPLLDHLILAPGKGYYSFADEGMI
jgi:DNA repair protein RadC